MTAALLDAPIRNWACPSCDTKTQTQDAPDADTSRGAGSVPMHNCPGLSGLLAPLQQVAHIDDAPDARHIVLQREDYVGRTGMSPIMAVHTERGDGSNDRTVFAPTATLDDLDKLAYGQNVAVQAGAAKGLAQHHRGFNDAQIRRMARIARSFDSMMAFGTGSKVFAHTVLDTLTQTKVVDWNSDTVKVALYGNSGTPDNTVATDVLTYYGGASSQWVTGNETSGTGYTAGGVAVTPLSVTQPTSTANVIFTSSGSPQWTSATISAYGALVYDTTVSVGLAYVSFGGSAQSVTAGTFTVAWNSAGICSFSF